MKLGIISDIHEDITRLKEAFDLLKKNNCDKIACLGDIVGYSVPYFRYLKSRDANQVVELIRKEADFVVTGNHDLYQTGQIPKTKNGFNYPKNWYNLEFRERKRLANEKIWLYEHDELSSLLNKEDVEYLGSLPEYKVIQTDEIRILLSHYAYPDFTGSTTIEYTKKEELAKHFGFMKKNKINVSVSGHDHGEGLKIITNNNERKISFREFKINPNEFTWISVPCVANGSFANGVTILDTKTLKVQALHLGSRRHVLPDWRKL